MSLVMSSQELHKENPCKKNKKLLNRDSYDMMEELVDRCINFILSGIFVNDLFLHYSSGKNHTLAKKVLLENPEPGTWIISQYWTNNTITVMFVGPSELKTQLFELEYNFNIPFHIQCKSPTFTFIN